MDKIVFALLRGVCQLPAYVAHAKGFLRDVDIDAELSIAPTAWTVPERLLSGRVQFAVIPWTRVAADDCQHNRLTLVSGSGIEEAAMVVRLGMAIEQVRDVAVPQEGGIKDLTAMALVQRLGWRDANIVRMPSGDGAILSFVGEGADAASMVEPYATMLEHLGLGRVIQRTGDVWPGAPGCSLTTTSDLIAKDPNLVQRMVSAYLRGVQFVDASPDESSEIAEKYIGISSEIIRKSLQVNRPDPNAIRNQAAMDEVIGLMIKRGYIDRVPTGYKNLSFLDKAMTSGHLSQHECRGSLAAGSQA
jgi:ABC-type nitrate/sulfonate/bicarbonate transport system substrate-binding protein